MSVHRRSVHFILVLFVVTGVLLRVQSGRSAFRAGGSEQASYESAVELPTSGGITERPFFSTRRSPSIDYSDSPTTDVVAELKHRMDEGSASIRFEGRSGYLRSVMEALHVPAESQSVVFSKTSLQSHYISPSNPRAIFYSDDVTVAFIPDAPLLEIAALDPRQGMVFYSVVQKPSERPQILRTDSCLS